MQKISNVLTLILSTGFFALVGFFGIIPHVSATIKDSSWLASGILNVPGGGLREIILGLCLVFFQITLALAVISIVVFVGQYFFGGQNENKTSFIKHNLTYTILAGIAVLAGLIILYSVKSAL